MANFRMIKTDFWKDEKIENFTTEEKYFWLFLLTNPDTTQLGIYKITQRRMSFYSGLEVRTIEELLNKFENEYDLLKYSRTTNEIAIKNFMRHNTNRGGKPWYDMLMKEMRDVRNKDLLAYVYLNLEVKEKMNNTIVAFYDELYNYISNCNYEEELKEIINNKKEEIRNVSNNDTYHDTQELDPEKQRLLREFFESIR